MSRLEPGRYSITWAADGSWEVGLPADCDMSDLTALVPIVRSVEAFALEGLVAL